MSGDRVTGGVGIEGAAVELRDNVIRAGGNPDGVVITGGTPRLVGNTISDKVSAIEVGAGAGAVIEGNTVTDNTTGILVTGTPATTLSITGNTFCGNTTDLDAPARPDLTLNGNVVCDPAAPAAP